MSTAHHPHRPTALRIILTAGRYLWLPVVLLLAVELAMPEEYSILHNLTAATQETIVHDLSPESEGGEHLFFGLPEAGGPADTAVGPDDVAPLGSWSGRFEASVPEETNPKCWSPVRFNLDLAEAGRQITGSGSYWVDPADCSVVPDRRQLFVTVFGERLGGRITLRLRDSVTGDLALLFEGLIMPKRLSGWFYRPDAQPATGPVTLRPSRQ